jgi:hypothetical protein
LTFLYGFYYILCKKFHFLRGLGSLLGGENASSSDSLDFLFSLAGEEASLHDDWLLVEGTLAKNLKRGGLEK